MKKSIVALLFLFVLSTNAQSWKYFTADNSNLPSNYIDKIYVENSNTIWFGTNGDGIVKYSNGDFSKMDFDSLKDNIIRAIVKDDFSYYWFGGEYYGLYSLHGTTFIHYSPAEMGFDFSPYESLHIRALAVQNGGPFNPNGKGALWIGTYSHGVIKFDGTNWVHYDYTNSVPLMSVFSIAVEESPRDTSYVVWIGTSNYPVKFDGKSWEKVEINGEQDKWVNAIALKDGGPTFTGGKLIMGTESGELCIFNGSSWNVFNMSSAWEPNNSITSIKVDNGGTVWFGTYTEGLGMYDGRQLLLYYHDNSGILSNQVLDLGIATVSDSTSIWVSTFDNNQHSYSGLSILTIANSTGVNENSSIPSKFQLLQNFPNPFNPTTVIKYTVAKESRVTLNVYNLLGEKIATLVNANQKAGNYKVNFNASNLTSGVYFYTLKAGNFKETKKMLLIK